MLIVLTTSNPMATLVDAPDRQTHVISATNSTTAVSEGSKGLENQLRLWTSKQVFMPFNKQQRGWTRLRWCHLAVGLQNLLPPLPPQDEIEVISPRRKRTQRRGWMRVHPCSQGRGAEGQGQRTEVRDESVQSGGLDGRPTGSKLVLERLGERAPVRERLGLQHN